MKKKTTPLAAVVLLVLVVGLVYVLTFLVRKYTPTSEVMSGEEYFGISEEQAALIVDTEVTTYRGKIEDEVVYVEYAAVKDLLNARFYWDADAELMLYTTPDDIIQIPAGSMEYTASGKKQSLNYQIVKTEGEKLWVALDFVQKYTNLDYEMYHDPERIVVAKTWGEVSCATVRKKAKVRQLGGIKSPILREVSKNEVVTVLEDLDDWMEVMTTDGYRGYIRSNALKDIRTETRSRDFEEPVYEGIHREDTISLVWHQTTSMESNYNINSDIANVDGVNVISPTWYSIVDNKGTISSLALSDYVNVAHSSGMEVWGLVDNFNTEVSFAEVMNHTDSRWNVEDQLIASARENGLDGINIDFESISEDAAEGYVQFMREMSVKCHKNKLVLSVDVPVPMPFTAHYNRKELGIVSDYVIVMGYDEHYSGSETAGSVASISFEKQGIENTLQDVPAARVISGVPFYTRLWSTKIQEDGTASVTSEAMGMSAAKQVLENNDVKASWDETTAQNYAEFSGDDGTLYQIWMEDEESLSRKLSLVKEYQLAGGAAWKLGFEKNSIWKTIKEYLS
ncbi:MAG: glycosyl hydrolase family 18 protein [Eubacteriales bacterium]|nr:glycosyl hydrolase family 18 protein [Eubacteriales bacterium]